MPTRPLTKEHQLSEWEESASASAGIVVREVHGIPFVLPAEGVSGGSFKGPVIKEALGIDVGGIIGGTRTKRVRPAPTRRVAKPPSRPDDPPMSAVGREEHDAKLQALEARIDGRIGQMETLLQSVAGGIARIETTMTRENGRLETQLATTNAAVTEQRRHITNVALTLFFGLVGVIALAATLYQTGLTARQVIGAQQPAVAAPASNSQPAAPPSAQHTPAPATPAAPQGPKP